MQQLLLVKTYTGQYNRDIFISILISLQVYMFF